MYRKMMYAVKKVINILVYLPHKKRKYKKNNVIINRGVKFNVQTCFEGFSKIYKHATIQNSYIGKGTYIGDKSILNNCHIGRFCSIAPYTEIVYGQHPLSFVSTHPAFYSKNMQAGFTLNEENVLAYEELRYAEETEKYSVMIGNDVWIGYGVTIMEGISIGDGAVIGARALVTKDIEPYSINVGIPAKKIGYRFEKVEIDKLLEIKWWEHDFDELRREQGSFNDVKRYLKEKSLV